MTNVCTQHASNICLGDSPLDALYQGVWMCGDCSAEYGERQRKQDELKRLAHRELFRRAKLAHTSRR